MTIILLVAAGLYIVLMVCIGFGLEYLYRQFTSDPPPRIHKATRSGAVLLFLSFFVMMLDFCVAVSNGVLVVGDENFASVDALSIVNGIAFFAATFWLVNAWFIRKSIRAQASRSSDMITS